jgi:hypothetical protein
VGVCHVAGQGQLCAWRPTIPAPGEGASGVRGVWDGVGLEVSTALAAAATDVELPPGRYRLSALVDTQAPAAAPEIRLTLGAGGVALEEVTVPLPAGTTPARIGGVVEHQGGHLTIEVRAERLWTTPAFFAVPTVWLSDLKIEAEVH